RAKSSISLFRMTPVPETRMPAPKPVLMVVVMAAALPSASTTETCAVPWSGSSAVFWAVGWSALSALRSAARRGGARSAPTGTRGGDDRRRARPPVEGPRPVRRERLQGTGEISLHDAEVGAGGAPAVGEEHAAEVRVAGEEVLAVLDLACEVGCLGQREPLAR